MHHHEEFRTQRTISVFLGDIGIEEAFEDYLFEDFPADFGFEIDPDDGPEFDFEARPKKIADLLDGFSWGEQFAPQVLEECANRGIEKAYCALVFYNFRYLPELAVNVNPNAPLRFLGVFDFNPVPDSDNGNDDDENEE
jgi:hypothetical protein